MIPVSLTIKGLYSYQKEQTIDFGKLLEGQLFGIFGSVGSGKSTILEAISYALYGDTERLNKTNDNRNYNMMNLKSNELLIDFVFVNYDEVQYRFLVRGKRNSKQFDKVSTLERSAYKMENGQWKPLESVSGEKVIGLSYDNFRRTIIIPQGKFQEFLQLGDSDRTRMLKEIFSLEKYEFFYQASSLEKKNNEELQRLGGELSAFANVTLEEIEQSKEHLQAVKLQLAKYKTDLGLNEERLKQQENVKQLHDAFRKNESELEVLTNRKPHYEAIRNQISAFNYCALHFKENLNKQASLSAELDKYRLQKSELTVHLDKTEKELQENETSLQQYKTESEKTEDYRYQLADYEIAVKTISLKKEIAASAIRIKNGETELQKVTAERDQLKEEIQAKTAQLKLLKAQMPDFNLLSAIRSWFSVLKNEQTNKEREEINLQKQLLKQSELKEKFNFLIANDLFAEKPTDTESAKSYLQKQKQAVLTDIADLQNKLTHYEVQLKLGEYTSALHDGSACPLCGSLEHPQILQVEDVNTHIHTVKEQLNTMQQKDGLLQKMLSETEWMIIHFKQQQDQIFEAEKQIKAVKTRLEKHYSEFKWDGFNPDNESLLDEKFKEAENLKKQIEQTENNLEDSTKKLQGCEDKHQRFKTGIDKIQRETDNRETEVSLLRNQFRNNNYEELINKDEEELNVAREKLQQHIAKIQAEFNRYSEQVNAGRQQHATLKAKIESLHHYISESENVLKNVEEQLSKTLQESEYQDIEEVKSVLNRQTDIQSLEADLKNYDLKFYNVQQKHAELKQQLNGKTFEETAFEELKNQVAALREQYQEKNNELVKEQLFLKQQEQNYERKLSIEQQMHKLELRKENISVLKNMFKGSGFVSYISGVYLNQLCASANERFYKLSRQQLRLEVTEKNDFQVRDYLNDGRLRNVKTLSGGQTFQASLSLALALAESVQQQNKSKQNFFFLDEGFGSLDKESLQVAFETLKSLRKENRIVGVISHVEELQQEIDVFLKVQNDAAEGSGIRGSWE